MGSLQGWLLGLGLVVLMFALAGPVGAWLRSWSGGEAAGSAVMVVIAVVGIGWWLRERRRQPGR